MGELLDSSGTPIKRFKLRDSVRTFSTRTKSWALSLSALIASFALLLGNFKTIRELFDNGGKERALLVEQAKAFEIGYLMVTFVNLSESETPPTVRVSQLKSYLSDLNVGLPHPLESYVNDSIGSDEHGRAMTELVQYVGGQILAKRPELLLHFQAGWNIPVDIDHDNGRNVNEYIKVLNLPRRLSTPRSNKLQWYNEVHQYLWDIHTHKISVYEYF